MKLILAAIMALSTMWASAALATGSSREITERCEHVLGAIEDELGELGLTITETVQSDNVLRSGRPYVRFLRAQLHLRRNQVICLRFVEAAPVQSPHKPQPTI